MTDRIAREPVGFAGAVKATLLAIVPLAIAFGWSPADPTELLAAVGGLGAVVELWATWWVRAAVTPEVVVQQRERDALAIGAVNGRDAAFEDLMALDAAKPAPRKRS